MLKPPLMALLVSFLLILLLSHPTSPSPSPSPSPAPGPATTDSGASPATTTTCPMDMSYVSTFPWDPSPCEPAAYAHNRTACCTTLLSVLGIAFAERLHSTGLFHLPSAASSAACLSRLGARLTSPPLSLSPSLVPSCFPSALPFAASPDYCAGIVNVSGWSAALRSSPAAAAQLATACGGDIASLISCGECYYAATEVSSILTALDGNTSHATPCFILTVLYAAGVVNARGPLYPPTANCTFGLALSSSSSPASPNPNPSPRRSRSAAAVAAISAAALALVLAAAALALLLRRSRRRRRGELGGSCRKTLASNPDPISPHPRPNTGSIAFDIRDLDKATDRFSPRNLVGRGGFGVVYRGALPDGSLVAVKKVLDPQLDDGSGSGAGVAGDDEFRNEVEIISNLRHRNLVPLRGYCIAHGDLFLVYDFMPNGSLDQHIFPSSARPPAPKTPKTLTWPERRSVVLDVAKGLAYLHYGVKPGIYHRDIKATNILLDREMRARVADFGLARRSRDGESHLTTRVAGTRGYLAPEYALYGQLTEKSDVYSFGVLVLEVMTGRRALDMAAASVPGSAVLVTDWAWALVRAGRAEDALDPPLLAIGGGSSGSSGGGNPTGIMVRFVKVGILCAHAMVALRPTIAEALRMLEGDAELPEIPDRPTPLGFHGLIYGDGSGADTFAASPAISALCLDAGDMLR